MTTEGLPSGGAGEEAGAEDAVRLPDDPRVPRPEDADPATSKELGGAAPAVGPGRPDIDEGGGTPADSAPDEGGGDLP